MATRIATATGDFLTAGTWGLIDAASYVNSESSTSTALTTSYAANTGVTTGVITVRGICLKLAVRTGTTGTMSVHLAIAGVEVVGTLVTINTADLPVAATADLNGGWIYFKFAGDVVLAGATSYTVEAKTSSASQVTLFAVSGTNWACAYQTTATGAPATGDDLIITGIHTTTGAPAPVTVSMDALASSITDYGAASTSLVTPSLAIGNSGKLAFKTTAATNYYLRQSGNVIVYSGGTLNIGTTGSPIPRDSSAILNFDSAANVDFGLTVRNLGTFTAQGLSRTISKNIYYCLLNTDEAIASTSLGVDTDTGWLDNDAIAVASTTRTPADSEAGLLNGAAGASSLTVDGFAGAGGGLAVAHSGTTPTQAEVILLTRNVQIFGASTTLQGYIDIKATAQVDCDWAEFKWLGSATALKRGIDIGTTTGSCNFQYCSLHDFVVTSSRGFAISAASGTGISLSNNVFWNIANSQFINVATSGTWIFDSNILIKNVDVVNSAILADVGGTFTNNIIVSSASSGVTFLETAGVVGTFSGNVAHSNGNNGVIISGTILNSTLTNTTSWRNAGSGLSFAAAFNNLIINTITCFGNSTNNIAWSAGLQNADITITSGTFSGDTTFATTNGLNLGNAGVLWGLKFINCDFSTVAGIKTAHTNDINISTTNISAQILLINTKLAAATEVATQANLTPISVIGAEKHDQSVATHKTWKKYGTIFYEITIVHTGTHSVKMTPISASNKLESSGVYGGFKVAVASGATVTPTVWVYEDATYNGARCQLIVKRNDAMGITADTVLDTRTGAADAVWESMGGVATTAVTDDGTLEFVVNCDGTAGNVFVDSFSVV